MKNKNFLNISKMKTSLFFLIIFAIVLSIEGVIVFRNNKNCIMTTCNVNKLKDSAEIEEIFIEECKVPLALEINNLGIDDRNYEYGTVKIVSSKKEINESNVSQITSLINGYNREAGVFVYNFYDGMTLTHNENSYIFASSTIKLPYTYFVCSEIAKKNASLDDMVLYKDNLRHSGSGILQYQPSGTYHSVAELLELVIHYSDNTAFYLLQDKFGTDKYRYIINCNGFKCTMSAYKKWDDSTAKEMGRFWQKIYYKYPQGGIWETYVNHLFGSQYSPIKDTLRKRNYSIASKSGWSELGYHDCGIVWGTKPYVIVVMTRSPGNATDITFMSRLIEAVDDFMAEYNSMYVKK